MVKYLFFKLQPLKCLFWSWT